MSTRLPSSLLDLASSSVNMPAVVPLTTTIFEICSTVVFISMVALLSSLLDATDCVMSIKAVCATANVCLEPASKLVTASMAIFTVLMAVLIAVKESAKLVSLNTELESLATAAATTSSIIVAAVKSMEATVPVPASTTLASTTSTKAVMALLMAALLLTLVPMLVVDSASAKVLITVMTC